MSKTELNMTTKYREALKVLETALPPHEAFKIALSLFIAHFLFNSTDSRIKAALDKRINKIAFPGRDMFIQADKLLSIINQEGSLAIELSDYTQKLPEAIQEELIYILTTTNMLSVKSSQLSEILYIEELSNIFPERVAEPAPASLTELFKALFLSGPESYRDRFYSSDPYLVYDDDGSVEYFTATGLSDMENAALWYFYNYSANPDIDIIDDLSYFIHIKDESEKERNRTIIFNPLMELDKQMAGNRYSFFLNEFMADLSLLTDDGLMGIVIPIPFLAQEGMLKRTLQSLVQDDAITAVIKLPENLFKNFTTCLVMVDRNKTVGAKGKVCFINPSYKDDSFISDDEITNIRLHCMQMISNWNNAAIVNNENLLDNASELLPEIQVGLLSRELSLLADTGKELKSICQIRTCHIAVHKDALQHISANQIQSHIGDIYVRVSSHALGGLIRRSSVIVSEDLDDLLDDVVTMDKETIENDKKQRILVVVTTEGLRCQIFDPQTYYEARGEYAIALGSDVIELIPDDSIDILYLYFQLYGDLTKKQVEALLNKPGQENNELSVHEVGSIIIDVQPEDVQRNRAAQQLIAAYQTKNLMEREENNKLLRQQLESIAKHNRQYTKEFIDKFSYEIKRNIDLIQGPIERVEMVLSENNALDRPTATTSDGNVIETIESAMDKAKSAVTFIRDLMNQIEKSEKGGETHGSEV